MRGKTLAITWLLGMCACVALGQDAAAEPKQREYRKPAFVTRFDIATRDECRLSHHLRGSISGDLVEDWPILEDIEDHLGEWITNFLSASRIATTIARAMPTNGQPPLTKVTRLVNDCCKILHVDPPEVFVRLHPFPQAYVKRVNKTNFLVLTSSLLKLYEGKPEELRFVIGHELGHLKCDHLKLRDASHGLLLVVQAINLAVVPDKYQVVLPTLALGRIFSWARASEISADRAGLLCCQDPQVAYNALSRLLHGLEANSEWIDPKNPDFDAEKIIKSFRQWENEPLVRFVVRIKKASSQHPFIPQRLAALKMWAEGGAYLAILERTKSQADAADQLVVITTIKAGGLAPKGEKIDPYVIAYDGDQKLMTTPKVKNCRAATWSKINVAHRCANGRPIFFEIWDSNILADTLVGGFVIYAVNPKTDGGKGSATYNVNIVWDWKERMGQTRTGLAQVKVEFRKRAKGDN